MTFSIEVETETFAGEQDLEVELSDCEVECSGESEGFDCTSIEKAEWDGADEMTFDADNGSEWEMERD